MDTKRLGTDDTEFTVSEEHSECVRDESGEIDRILGLQSISIRLPKQLIEDFKMFAQLEGIGYQPLIRQCLVRFADGEKRRIAMEEIHRQLQIRAQEDQTPRKRKIA